MTTQTEALKMALEGAANYIDTLGGDSRKYRQVLAQPEQEPVKVGRIADNIKGMVLRQEVMLYTDDYLPIGTALYTTPPQRKPLTRGQIREIEVDVSLNPSFDYITPAEQLCRAIEAAHGIKE